MPGRPTRRSLVRDGAGGNALCRRETVCRATKRRDGCDRGAESSNVKASYGELSLVECDGDTGHRQFSRTASEVSVWADQKNRVVLLGLGARLRNTRVTDETDDVANARTGIG